MDMAKKKEITNNQKPITDYKSPIALREEEILKFWKEKVIFQKTLAKDSPSGDFVFYEGPPTANGRPGIHHLESRAFKDVIPRYKTMQGFHVNRRAGWDTHGLPVELEVEKKLGLKSKKEIESYGIAKFNDECKKSAWTYIDEWKDFTERMGYWLDFDHAYVTYKPEYIESVWHILAKVNEQKLLYKDYKVLPWCPRCGTALSSHELAQGYQDDKDLSVTVKFKVKQGQKIGDWTVDDKTFILAWTTTPWTLPGNVALAVGNDIDYVRTEENGENLILAEKRLGVIKGVVGSNSLGRGKDLIGLEYESLFPELKTHLGATKLRKEEFSNWKNGWKIYAADFVTTDDGTGVVHTSVMYGQEDFDLGTKYNLPKLHTVDETGHFLTNLAPSFLMGRYVKEKDENGKPNIDVDIINYLKDKNLFFSQENYKHSYPHCWRCGTPLIYYARDSWYIKMSSLREKLLSENAKINWEPEYIRDGRFGEWLREVKDWAISRERYWGTPLPVWQNEDKSETLVVDSIEMLKKYTKSNGNTFIFVRHGEAENNIKGICSFDIKSPYHLTETGESQSLELAKQLKSKKISTIYTSPYLRTRETADILCEGIGLDKKSIAVDDRIHEYNFGDFDGKKFTDYLKHEEEFTTSYDVPLPNGESYQDSKNRFGQFVFDIDTKHKNETILVVTHGIGLEVMAAIAEGAAAVRSKEIIDTREFGPASTFEFNFIPLPHNENYELDLHKPFIDEVVLVRDGKDIRRVKEVMDVWFDSGSMPFAQNSESRGSESLNDLFKKAPYPADYISEAIDQTRGWFYTLHAIGILMNRGLAFQNVICLGHILDKDGQKMSKSKGNTVNPFVMIDKYGVDALRFWMYTVNQPGESKNFDEKTVDEIIKKVFNLLLNVVNFYELYADEGVTDGRPKSENVLDQWMLAYLDEATLHMTRYLEDYKVLEAGRLIKDFVADLSQWYVRRSRDRFKESNGVPDKKMAQENLRYVLVEFSKLIAPFMPFLAEDIYQRLKTKDSKESVHLESWPEVTAEHVGDVVAIKHMNEVRRLTTLALEARAKSGIKVRQPLTSITIKGDSLVGLSGYTDILADEVNVKKIVFDEKIESEVTLDTEITDELKLEGAARELMRAIKERGLSSDDKVSIIIKVNKWGKKVVDAFKKEIIATCSLTDIAIEGKLLDGDVWFEIIK